MEKTMNFTKDEIMDFVIRSRKDAAKLEKKYRKCVDRCDWKEANEIRELNAELEEVFIEILLKQKYNIL